MFKCNNGISVFLKSPYFLEICTYLFRSEIDMIFGICVYFGRGGIIGYQRHKIGHALIAMEAQRGLLQGSLCSS